MVKNKKAQSSMEYLVIFGILVVVFVIVAGRFQGPIRQIMQHLRGQIAD